MQPRQRVASTHPGRAPGGNKHRAAAAAGEAEGAGVGVAAARGGAASGGACGLCLPGRGEGPGGENECTIRRRGGWAQPGAGRLLMQALRRQVRQLQVPSLADVQLA